MNFKNKILIYCSLLTCPLTLIGCLPVAFTGAAASTYTLAKTKTIGESVDDTRIASQIKAEFIKNGFRKLYSKITVEVSNGRVLYIGRVSSEEDKMNAIRIAWNQIGVKDVIDQLVVDKNSDHFDLKQYTKDTWITSQVKSKIFANRSIKFVNYNILTSKNIVYIFGISQSLEELEKVANIAAKVKGVERVVDHVKILDTQVEHSNSPHS